MRQLLSLFLATLFGLVTPSLHAADDRFDVAILMFDRVQIIDFAAPYEVFGHAQFNVFTVSEDGGSVTTEMGLKVQPDYSFANMPKADAIIVPGGSVMDVMKDTDVQQWLQTQLPGVDYMLSVCTGVAVLAESGLLDGLTATNFHGRINWLAQTYPDINVVSNLRYTDNGKIITSAGLSSGVDAALHLVGRVQGMERAKTIAMHIEYNWNEVEGFVRGAMSDRHMPRNTYSWPSEVNFSNNISYGDKEKWHRSIDLTIAAEADAVFNSIDTAMQQHEDWRPVSSGNNTKQWQKEIDGATWQLTYAVSASDNETTDYKVVSDLVKVQ